ncbi:TPA: hypothetical protein ACK3Q6_004035 [Burkholderia cepacia]|jgi:hypothetical protein|uniref:Uncharacterized protein n=4 Tax=Burkholderia cepacia complex TaxID=87882 RepID=A0A286T8H8_9BURK|nr:MULTISPECIES: hypothetical protein [Burkholderia]MBA9831054.1 hypothetical protein [Burkholderia contaminans]MBA9839114.1 hypothetical protein [Burkholderia contaminans]MBA9906694.1 hypothetical protein [Burkholderia contaminans]MBX3822867.1 hypothetical protein [Burkholderia contaminans]MBX3843142.1 hypothetical protein [Burkholderia contaminans]
MKPPPVKMAADTAIRFADLFSGSSMSEIPIGYRPVRGIHLQNGFPVPCVAAIFPVYQFDAGDAASLGAAALGRPTAGQKAP